MGLGFRWLDARRPPPKAAAKSGRGAESSAHPGQFSLASWRTILTHTYLDFSKDQIPAVAAGVTFFVLLATFPSIGAFVSLFGLFANVDDARRQVLALEGVLPSGAVSVIGDQMARLAAMDHGRLGLTLVLSLGLSIWSSNAGVKALINGLNIAYEQKERRNFLVLNALSLCFTLGFTVFAILAVSAIVALPAVMAAVGLQAMPAVAGLSLLRWPLLLITASGGLSLLYRYAPCRPHARWRWITPGGLVAGVGWLLMSGLFSWYVAHFGSYDRTYGSLGAIVGFMTWIWLSMIVVLLGAELDSELELQTTADTLSHAGRRP
jgi:membrane protein